MDKQKTLEELREDVRRKESAEDPVEVEKKNKLTRENLGDLYDLQLSGKDISHIPSYRLIDEKNAVPQTLPSLEANDWPDWLKSEYYSTVILRCDVAGVATKLDRKLSEKIKKAMIQHRVALHYVAAAVKLAPEVSEPAQTCFQMLLQHKKLNIETALNNALPAWKRERDGVKRGHAAKDFNWMNELDNRPEWMEQKPRGKSMGWKVSSTFIVNKILRSDGCPQDYFLHPSTVTRERNRRKKPAITPPK